MEIRTTTEKKQSLRKGLMVSQTLNIMYFEESRHYRPILSPVISSGMPYFCELCNKSYYTASQHKCAKKCLKCFSAPPCLPEEARMIRCEKCNRSFYGVTCLCNHVKKSGGLYKKKSVCEAIKVCQSCWRTIRHGTNYICGYDFCKKKRQ